MLYQLVSLAGAAMVLAAYAALQRGWLRLDRRTYHALNFFGSALLTWIAVADGRWGFIALEGIWALLSVPGMLSPRRERAAP